MSTRCQLVCALAALCGACEVRGIIGSNESLAGATGSTSGAMAETATDTNDAVPEPQRPLLDLAAACVPPPMPVCAEDVSQWWQVIGICADSPTDEFWTEVSPQALELFTGELGTSGVFVPQEGESMVILSTGIAAQLQLSPSEFSPDCIDVYSCPDTDLSGQQYLELPAPIVAVDVSSTLNCSDDPALIGTGDCSNSIAQQWVGGEGAYDYSQLRMRLEVPDGAGAFQYQFAFFSTEYPEFFFPNDPQFNDMYVAWLESESWTGNVSFDDFGSPITVNSAFLDYKTPSRWCVGCTAPELDGFAMQYHAGTRWLTTLAPVRSGEVIEIVFAIFDMTDPGFDTVVLIDNFEWTCADGNPPLTTPAA